MTSKRIGGPRFSIRGLLAITLIIGLACGWFASVRRELARTPPVALVEGGDSAFQNAIFHGGRLQGSTLRGDVSAFQNAQFNRSQLHGTTLTAGGASFQSASFADVDLSGATVSAECSSFQLASFAGANLSAVRLSCDHTSFQGVNFTGASLVGATLRAQGQAFQGVRIDGAQFQRADLSEIDAQTLASCSFTEPPLYDDETRFPPRFDPVAQQWQHAPNDK
jgi:uncharacterized protein YjbI with pentapeptide repeats